MTLNCTTQNNKIKILTKCLEVIGRPLSMPIFELYISAISTCVRLPSGQALQEYWRRCIIALHCVAWSATAAVLVRALSERTAAPTNCIPSCRKTCLVPFYGGRCWCSIAQIPFPDKHRPLSLMNGFSARIASWSAMCAIIDRPHL